MILLVSFKWRQFPSKLFFSQINMPINWKLYINEICLNFPRTPFYEEKKDAHDKNEDENAKYLQFWSMFWQITVDTNTVNNPCLIMEVKLHGLMYCILVMISQRKRAAQSHEETKHMQLLESTTTSIGGN